MSHDPETTPGGPLKDERVAPPPPRPPSLLERPIPFGTLEKPIDLDACRKFFSLSGGSILYCLSAMCVIYGVAAALGPLFARSFALRETLPCLAALNVYEIALLAVLLVIVLRQNVTDDAISLVVLSGVFLVVSGLALTTTANSRPQTVLLIGACCFVLSMAKIFVLRRFVGMSISPLLWSGLGVVLAWNFLAGARLADLGAVKTIGREPWLLLGAVLLLGGILVLIDAALRRPETPGATGERVPFLRRPAMGWILALILFFAASVHQRALAYVFSLDVTGIDFLPFLCVLALVLSQVARHLSPRLGWLAAGLAAFPIAAFLVVLTEDPVIAKPAAGIALVWYPPVFLGLTGAAALITGLRWKQRTLFVVAAFYALGVVLTLTTSAATPGDLHWRLAGAILVSGLFVAGLVKRSAALCVAAIVLATGGFAQTHAFEDFAKFLDLDGWAAAFGLAGLGALIVALLFGRMPSAVLVPAALAVMACAFDFLPSALGWKDLSVALVLLALVVALWMRLRHRPSLVILCVPLGWRLAIASVQLAHWRYILLGFVLLLAGAWVSIRKGKRARAEAEKLADAG